MNFVWGGEIVIKIRIVMQLRWDSDGVVSLEILKYGDIVNTHFMVVKEIKKATRHNWK